jgi:hypothetical protein
MATTPLHLVAAVAVIVSETRTARRTGIQIMIVRMRDSSSIVMSRETAWCTFVLGSSTASKCWKDYLICLFF